MTEWLMWLGVLFFSVSFIAMIIEDWRDQRRERLQRQRDDDYDTRKRRYERLVRGSVTRDGRPWEHPR